MAALLVPLLAMAPPADGAMLLIPIVPERLVGAVAVRHGALILGNGPIAGSLIVRGRAADLTTPLLAQGILLLRAPASLCTGMPRR